MLEPDVESKGFLATSAVIVCLVVILSVYLMYPDSTASERTCRRVSKDNDIAEKLRFPQRNTFPPSSSQT